MRSPRFPFLFFWAFAAAASLALAASPLRARFGAGASLGASLGYGLAVAVTLAVFAIELRSIGRSARRFRGLGIGFLVKLVLLGGGTLLGRVSGAYDGIAYALGFAAGIAVAGVAGVLQVLRTLPSRARVAQGR